MRIASPIELTEDERKALNTWARGKRTAARLVTRAQIVLKAAEGLLNKEIAPQVGVSRWKVARWRERFARQRLAGIVKDAPRAGRRPTKRQEQAPRIIEATTQTRPPHATHWSVRTLAKALGVKRGMVHQVWKANGLKPHLERTFKVSRDPRFLEKVMDVVGLYLNPPEHALVLCVDEKSQIQALDRTQRGLPVAPGAPATRTHDYRRNGTTTLFAALEMTEGRIIGTCMDRHRHHEWIEFLKQVDQQTPRALDLHLIADNYATHKHPRVRRWLRRHPRFHLHFIPTSSSWLNLVERWFRDLTDKCIRRGTFQSVPELVATITDYVDHHNSDPIPFVWTAKARDIIEKYRRAQAVLDKLQTV